MRQKFLLLFLQSLLANPPLLMMIQTLGMPLVMVVPHTIRGQTMLDGHLLCYDTSRA